MLVLADISHTVKRWLWEALKGTIVPAIGCAVLAYFIYYAIHGDRGILARHQIEIEIATAQRVLADVRGERERMEIRADRLRRDQLDVDLLDERARDLLNFAHPDDLIVPLPKLYEEEGEAR